MTRRSRDTERLAKELASLPHLDREELLQCWRALYGTAPSAKISRPILIRALAYRLQERTLGGLKSATRRLLQRVAERARAGAPIDAVPRPTLGLGTRLLREWNGVTHEAIVVESGVLFRGQHYRSLSEVARVITGSRWSGPRFFGLKSRARRGDP